MACAVLLGLLGWLIFDPAIAPAQEAQPGKNKPIREIFVPFEDLPVLLEGHDQHVFLTRQEYEGLVAQAKFISPEEESPRTRVFLSADYEGTVQDGRAILRGVLQLEVMSNELLGIGIPMRGVSLRSAKLDGAAAALGRGKSGEPVLFVRGKGKHELVMEMIAPVVVTAAEQRLQFQLTSPVATRWRLTVPGNVEIRSGAAVIRREVDAEAELTRFELLPQRGPATLVMSLNNRILQRDRVVLARSVLIGELTESYERLHASVALAIPHGAVDRFQFTIPAGFEVVEVSTPLLARWAMQSMEGGERALEVVLREATTDSVMINIVAMNLSPAPADWTLRAIRPLDVASHVAVVGVIAEERLAVQSMLPTNLIPIDVSVLNAALPETVFRAEPGAARVRPVAAYYAPDADFSLAAAFRRASPRIDVTSNLLFTIHDKRLELRGGFAILPAVEKLFTVNITVPAGWQVLEVTRQDGTKLPYEIFPGENEASRLHIRLPQGAAPGSYFHLFVRAEATPPGWLNEWARTSISIPTISVSGAQRDMGAIAIKTLDDIDVRPDQLAGLTPLAEKEKEEFGLAETVTNVAYRYESQPYSASLVAERNVPRLTARTMQFLRLQPEGLQAHYELLYNVEHARARRVAFRLPLATPAAITIRGLEGAIKESRSEVVDGERRWIAELSEPRLGLVRLAVEFLQPLPEATPKDYVLPLIRAENVDYQSSTIAVEGNPEFDVAVKTSARPVDVGELVEAEYQAGNRLLGVYGFVGEPGAIVLDVFRRPDYGLPAALVQRAELVTLLSAHGLSQTAARYQLRSKAMFLEFRLPPNSILWAATVDGKPTSPQREGDHLLVSLPPTTTASLRDLQFVYETPVAPSVRWGSIATAAPRLFLRDDRNGESAEVPMADLVWTLVPPEGHQVVRSAGSVSTESLEPALPPLATVGAATAYLGGGLTRRIEPGLGQVFSRPFGRAREMAATPATANGSRRYFEDGAIPYGADTLRGGAIWNDREAKSLKIPAASELRSRPLADAMPQAPSQRTRDGLQTAPETDFSVDAPHPATAREATRGKTWYSEGKYWALQGVRSLPIELARSGDSITFTSMGIEPRLAVTLISRHTLWFLAALLAILVAIAGISISGRNASQKVRFLVAAAVATLGVPAVLGLVTDVELSQVFHPAFFVACALVPWYLLVGLTRWSIRNLARWSSARFRTTSSATTAAALIFATMALPQSVWGQQPADDSAAASSASDLGNALRHLLLPPSPVKLPADAIILPYDPDDPAGPRDAMKVLLPYEEYARLWDAAFPDKPLKPRKLPAEYAIAGASYTATLIDDESLTLTGRMELEVFSDQPLEIPLSIRGGVLTHATLDGQGARIRIVEPEYSPAVPLNPSAEAAARPIPEGDRIFVLQATGAGRKVLEMSIRFKISRSGGWRMVDGRVPVATATAFDIVVPRAQTEVRIAGSDPADLTSGSQPAAAMQAATGLPHDVLTVETETDNQAIPTAIPADGVLSLRWRPLTTEAQVDQSLTARSIGVLDVQEDGVRLVWRTLLEYRRGVRDSFTFDLPAGFLVERVAGANVRGWKAVEENGSQRVDVTLLQPVGGQETMTLVLSRRFAVPPGGMQASSAPAITARGAALQQGTIVLRRSPLLEIRIDEATGLSRADITEQEISQVLSGMGEESPLGIRHFQAYRFSAVPYHLRLRVTPFDARTSVVEQALLKVGDRGSQYETRLLVNVDNRPRFEVTAELPAGLLVDAVEGPAGLEWTVVAGQDESPELLRVFLPEGQRDFSLLVRGRLPHRAGEVINAPRLVVRDVDRQSGYLVVQADPAYDVRADNLQGCENILMQRVAPWLKNEQGRLARVALFYPAPTHVATLRVVPRQALVNSFTISNLRVTPFAVEETVYLQFQIRNAGIREVVFRLPAAMRDARFTVPLLRQKTIESIADQPGYIRVRLALQDEVTSQLIVLVEHDRAVTSGPQDVPIPIIETGVTDHRFVVLENAGWDEVIVSESPDFGELNRQQSEWSKLVAILGDKITRAYVIRDTARDLRLSFQTKQRAVVETARARIGLSKTLLMVDNYGAYRGVQEYLVDNKTEQYLEVELPEGADLWTVRVASEAVKPTIPPNAANPRCVRVPLIKTAPGDLDYPVELKYGGRLRIAGPAQKTRFPLMHTVNIRVEQSQVRLRLPESHQWFDFGGTMRLVGDEGSLTAGYLSYKSKQIEQLLDVAREGDEFTKLRATNNLRLLDESFFRVQSRHRHLGENAELQRELSNNSVLLQRARQTLHEPGTQPFQTALSDNRSVLSMRCNTQELARAKNVVTQLSSNFSDVKGMNGVAEKRQPAEGEPLSTFNVEWLRENGFKAAPIPDAMPDSKEEAKPDSGAAGNTKSRVIKLTEKQSGIAMEQEGVSAANELGRKLAKDSLQDESALHWAADPQSQTFQSQAQSRFGDVERQLERYEERLQRQQTANEPVAPADPFSETGEAAMGRTRVPDEATSTATRDGRGADDGVMGSSQVPMGGFGGGRQDSEGGLGVDRVDTAGGRPETTIAGMKSLDVNLPHRGREYKFMTPRGEIEITARAITTRNQARGMTIAMLAMGVVVVAGGARAVRLVLTQANHRLLGALMILLAAASILSGFLPVFGVVCGILGIAWLLRRRPIMAPTDSERAR